MNEFPISDWFNTSQKISKEDIKITEAQMLLYAIKDGKNPKEKESKQAIKKMIESVKLHNQKLKK